MTLTLGTLTLNLFHRFTATRLPPAHRDAYLSRPGWLMLKWREWHLEVHHLKDGWLAKRLVGLPKVQPEHPCWGQQADQPGA